MAGAALAEIFDTKEVKIIKPSNEARLHLASIRQITSAITKGFDEKGEVGMPIADRAGLCQLILNWKEFASACVYTELSISLQCLELLMPLVKSLDEHGEIVPHHPEVLPKSYFINKIKHVS